MVYEPEKVLGSPGVLANLPLVFDCDRDVSVGDSHFLSLHFDLTK